MKERLYIVDGHGYIFRAHYGLITERPLHCAVNLVILVPFAGYQHQIITSRFGL